MTPKAVLLGRSERQQWLWVAGGLGALVLLRSHETAYLAAQLLVLLLCLTVLLNRAHRSRSRRRSFWLACAALVASRSSLQAQQLFWSDDEQRLSAALAAALLGLLFVLAGVAAAQLVPKTGERRLPDWLIDVAATGAVAISTSIYFVAVPGLQVPRQFDAWPATRFLFVVLDLLVYLHALAARDRASSGRWRSLASWVGLLAGLWFLTDAAACFAALWPGAFVTELITRHDTTLAIVPFLWVLGNLRTARPSVASIAAEKDSPVSWLLLYTAALPAAHIALYATGWLNPTTRGVRDVVVLTFVLLMGALGLVREVFFDSRRRHTELQRRRADQLSILLRSALEIMPLGLSISDADGNVLYRNQTLAEMIGGDRDAPLALPSPGRTADRSTGRPATRTTPSVRQLTLHRADGSPLPLLLLSEPIAHPAEPSGVEVTSFEDLSAMQEAEARLRSAEERYQRLTDALPVAVLVLDSGEHLMLANPAARLLFGLDAPAGHHGGSLLPQLLKQLARAPDQQTLSLLAASGATLELHVVSDVIQLGHRPARRLVVRDVSWALELRRRNREVADLAARGQMSATLAHEIRNPLASITLNLELLAASDSTGSEAEPDLVLLLGSVRQLQQIASGVLELTRLAPLQPSVIDLGDLLGSCFPAPARLAPSAARPPSANVRVDLQQMRRVVDWLIQNAREATPGPPILSVSVETTSHLVSILVADYGDGVDAALSRRIFEPFFSTRPGHAGLGLTLAAAIVQRHGGEIQLEEDPAAKGSTCFRIVLPRFDGEAA